MHIDVRKHTASPISLQLGQLSQVPEIEWTAISIAHTAQRTWSLYGGRMLSYAIFSQEPTLVYIAKRGVLMSSVHLQSELLS